MDIEFFREYCLSKKGVHECFPFGPETLVFKVMGKVFALAGLDHLPHRVNLKCDPSRAVELRDLYPESIIPGYHMNKIHWNTVYLESGLEDFLIRECIDHSYDLIVQSLPKATRSEWANI